jgi:hypothetical protein
LSKDTLYFRVKCVCQQPAHDPAYFASCNRAWFLMTASLSSEESSPVVRFEGDWSACESELVEEAVEEAETDELPSFARFHSAPWVATCHNQEATDVYAASRIGVNRVLSARSASGLAERIREFARSESSSDGSA